MLRLTTLPPTPPEQDVPAAKQNVDICIASFHGYKRHIPYDLCSTILIMYLKENQQLTSTRTIWILVLFLPRPLDT